MSGCRLSRLWAEGKAMVREQKPRKLLGRVPQRSCPDLSSYCVAVLGVRSERAGVARYCTLVSRRWSDLGLLSVP